MPSLNRRTLLKRMGLVASAIGVNPALNLTARALAESSNEEEVYSADEVTRALRNHGLPLEGLQWDITPIGMHFLWSHFDIPRIDPTSYRLDVWGAVKNRLQLKLQEVQEHPSVTVPVVMECAGPGRATPPSQPVVGIGPWKAASIGCSLWTGTPLHRVLDDAGLDDRVVEIVFGGQDRGIDAGVEHSFERSLPLSDALRDEVLLVWAQNGQSLAPQHGFPLRLVVPNWYGMASVKWLTSIRAMIEPFKGTQQVVRYRYKQTQEDPGTPVTKINVQALMVPPGIPDVMHRTRYVNTGQTRIEGRAWSGWGGIKRVEFSEDGGLHWHQATLGQPVEQAAWTPWFYDWDVTKPGEYKLKARAADTAGNVQPLESRKVWNADGYGLNTIQEVLVVVR